MSFAIFVSDAARVASAPLAWTIASLAASAANRLGARTNGQAGEVGEPGRARVAEPVRRVQAGADGGRADRELVEVGERLLDPLEVVVELGDVAGELLPEGERDRILQMGPTDLHDVGPGGRLRIERVAQRTDGRQEPFGELRRGGDVHRGRERVVRGLREVDVVVRVHGGLRAELAPRDLDRPVRDDLVHVHVGLGARPRLPHVEGEVVVEGAGEDLVGGRDDQVRQRPVQQAAIRVLHRGGLLEEGESAHHLHRHAVRRRIADREVMQRPLGLRAPIAVGRDLDGSDRVGLGSGVGHRDPFILPRHETGDASGAARSGPPPTPRSGKDGCFPSRLRDAVHGERVRRVLRHELRAVVVGDDRRHHVGRGPDRLGHRGAPSARRGRSRPRGG